MDEIQATPDPEVEAPSGDTPEGEPVETFALELEADQSAVPGPIAQAEYTRATQVVAAVRRELGLPKGATQAEVIAALQAARSANAVDADEVDEEDPGLVMERQRRITAELRFTTAIYGEEFTTDALALLNAARTSDDLEELITMVAAFRDTHAMAPASAPADQLPPLDDVLGQAEQDFDLSEGDPAFRPQESTPTGRREQGVTSAVRGLFEAAGIATRAPRT